MNRPFHLCLALLVLGLCPSAHADDDCKALHERIDELVEARLPDAATNASATCTDAEFLRRVTLDLAGTIPSADQTREFLADKTDSSVKRKRLVERLLDDPRHARRMQYVLDSMLMERRPGKNVADQAWRDYLRKSAAANKPWDQLAREILAADGADTKARGPAKFYLDREFDVDLVTRDVGRLFLGVDLECAQCHNHPVIEAYLQRHYYGITAFLKRSYVFTDPKTKKKSLGEKAEGDVSFTSVFDDSTGKTSPRILDLPERPDPDGTLKQYITEPKKDARGVPKYSRRAQLGLALTAKENVDFRRNAANRLWALMMGRGLVEPLDVRHPDNPPTHPRLLELLAGEFAAHAYDIRWLLREIALTRAYQRSSIPRSPESATTGRHYAIGLLKPLSPEQLAWSVMQATGVIERTRRQEIAKAAKSAADDKAGKKDQEPKAEGPGKATPAKPDITAAVEQALAAHVQAFVDRFAEQGGQKTTFSATAPQALFLLNGPLIRGWLEPADGNLGDRLNKLDTACKVAEELYISVLSRRPSQEERKEIAAFLESGSDRGELLRELGWALLISAEFRFNH